MYFFFVKVCILYHFENCINPEPPSAWFFVCESMLNSPFFRKKAVSPLMGRLCRGKRTPWRARHGPLFPHEHAHKVYLKNFGIFKSSNTVFSAHFMSRISIFLCFFIIFLIFEPHKDTFNIFQPHHQIMH